MKWVLKIFVKILLARLPFSYEFWKLLGFFRHGRMDTLEYPRKIFNLHLSRAFPGGLPLNSVVLELGPGDSIASALLSYSSGASLTYLVDVEDFAQKDVSFYKTLADELSKNGLKTLNFSKVESFNDVLSVCSAKYLTSGLSSLKKIPSKSVDFIWSHSVLEHVRKKDLLPVLHELKRIVKPTGFSSHVIDYQDHLNFSLNNLRFSEKLWESNLFANSGFYTNRVPAVFLHKMFKDAGFEILSEEFGKWPSLPISRHSLNAEFQELSDSQLINRTSNVLLK